MMYKFAVEAHVRKQIYNNAVQAEVRGAGIRTPTDVQIAIGKLTVWT